MGCMLIYEDQTFSIFHQDIQFAQDADNLEFVGGFRTVVRLWNSARRSLGFQRRRFLFGWGTHVNRVKRKSTQSRLSANFLAGGMRGGVGSVIGRRTGAFGVSTGFWNE